MLTITRKDRECIIVQAGDEQIVIVVKQIRKNSVRLGIEAPADMLITRNTRDCDQLDPHEHNVIPVYHRGGRRKGWE